MWKRCLNLTSYRDQNPCHKQLSWTKNMNYSDWSFAEAPDKKELLQRIFVFFPFNKSCFSKFKQYITCKHWIYPPPPLWHETCLGLIKSQLLNLHFPQKMLGGVRGTKVNIKCIPYMGHKEASSKLPWGWEATRLILLVHGPDSQGDTTSAIPAGVYEAKDSFVILRYLSGKMVAFPWLC